MSEETAISPSSIYLSHQSTMFLFSSKRISCYKTALKFVIEKQSPLFRQQSCTHRLFTISGLISKRNLGYITLFNKNIWTLSPVNSLIKTWTKAMSDIKNVDNHSTNDEPSKAFVKPPAVLVYTGDNEESYRQIYSSLNKILPESTFSITHISSKAFSSDLWYNENIAFIIICSCESLSEQMLSKLKLCSQKKIKMICNRSMEEFDSNVVTFNLEPVKFAAEDTLLLEALKTLGFEVKENQRIPDLTCGYFICQPDDLTWEMEGLEFGSKIGNSPTLLFEPAATFPSDISPSASNLPIKVCRRKNGFPENVSFDTVQYYQVLKTKALGRALLFIPVCETTMNISKSLRDAMPTVDGIVVVAESQTNGIGRSGNQWLSPKGCALLTFNYNVPLSSNIGSNATFIQLILAVSICDAVKSLLELPDFPICIKWPNDIYFERKYKLGGIMVTAANPGKIMQCTIGAGINVANSKPTICINDLLPSDSEKRLTVEEVIAETMNKFEYYINMFENEGRQAFLRHYYKLWLHSDEEVQIQHSSNNEMEMVVIKGLDEYGYLQVEGKNSGKVFSVHDDGNTFDMMKGLIRPKNR